MKGATGVCAVIGLMAVMACAQPEPPSTTARTAPDGEVDCLPDSPQWVGHGDLAEDARGFPTALEAAQTAASDYLRPGDGLVQIVPLRFSIVRQGREVVVISVAVAPQGGFLSTGATGCDE